MKKHTYYILYSLLALSISCENKEEAGFSVDYTSATVAAAGGETSFAIQASGKWSASKTTSWITITPTAGTGNQTLTVTVKENEDDEQNTPQRTAKIYILSGPNTETLTITQEGKDHPLPSAPEITLFNNMPCERGLTITAPVEYAVSYRWYKNDVVIPGATAASYTTSSSGTYTVAGVNKAKVTGAPSAGYPITINPCQPAAAKAIEGAATNNCSAGAAASKEANTITLTVPEIEFATSYTWYYNGGSGEVEMQTGASRSYTAVISGSYTVKGVNEVDEGAPSPVKVVNITPCVALVHDANYNQFICQKSTLNTASGNNMVDPFLSVYDEMAAGFAAAGTITLGNMRFRITSTSTVSVGVISGLNLYALNYTFNTDPDGTITFTNPANSTGTTTTNAYIGSVANMVAYLAYSGTCTVGPSASPITVQPSGNKFRLGWIPNNNEQTGILFGLYLVSDPHSYIPGVLSKY
jgi:hypothetical protein